MPKPLLSRAATKLIETKVDEVFDRLKARALGPHLVDKQIVISYRPELSIPGIFEAAAREEGTKADADVLDSLLNVCAKYIDGSRERSKARVVSAVQAYLNEAQASGVDTDLRTVLGGRLSEVWRDVTNHVHAIVDAEATNAKNVGSLDGIIKLNTYLNIDDPVIYFVVVRDGLLCGECKRLHLDDDGVTPRLWRLSELSHEYHKRGGSVPSVGGLHPHCRCSMVTLMPGYGFNKQGMVEYKGPDYDALAD